ncbi:MAG: tyrosine-protein phosphatase [Candidatus Methanomethylophilaceae archaeon]|nr:tyrosine-protein phosphatase [Candidatus Methanomethylophilaceae archaeon]
MKPGMLYRSFSPLYPPDKQTRSAYVDGLAEKAEIQYLISLSYSDDSVKKAVEDLGGYCVALCREGDYVAPSMGYLYFQEKEKTVSVLKGIMDNDGPYLVHCNVGRDRTGFVVLLLQSLCGCSADEMRECESKAFCNLYHIETGSPEYEAVKSCTYDRNMFLIADPSRIPDMFDIAWDSIDVSSVDPYSAAYSYCTEYLGFTDDEVQKIRGSCAPERPCLSWTIASATVS